MVRRRKAEIYTYNRTDMLTRMTLIFLCYPALIFSQGFQERFESNTLMDWDILKGNADLVTDPVYEGRQAIRLWQDVNASDLVTLIRHHTFSARYGSYYIYTRADGPVSDADFIFQFVDDNNYYFVSNKPSNTDNPEILLGKVVNGQYAELARMGPVADRAEWLKFQIDRTCAGDIRVWINNRLAIEVVDQDITQPGSVGLAAWEQFSYFDSLAFEPERPAYEVNLVASACAGHPFTIGGKTYDSSGYYVDTLTSLNGCDSVVRLQLTFFPAIEVDTQFSICTGSAITIGTHAYTLPGAYTDTLSSFYGCDSIIHFNLSVSDAIVIYRDTLLCMGDSLELDRQIIVQPGTYRIPYISSNNCDSIIEWTVTADPQRLDLGSNVSWCPGQSLTLQAGMFSNYLWSNGTTNPTLSINQQGMVWVEVMDDAGCTLRDTVMVTEYCALQVFAPNIFSPNDDSVNDRWKPAFSQPPGSYEVQIYDRWGNMVFSSHDPEESWDGRARLQPLLPGVYIWKIKADDQLVWGDLTLVR